MSHFHAVALFEARGSSFDETDQAVASLLASISHRRLRYYEHETTEGPRSDRTAAYFVIFADFDVEAYSEEKAADLVDEVLDAVSTDAIQYFSHGLLSGEQRVRSARQAPIQAPIQEEQEEQEEQNEQEEQEEQNEQNEQNERDDEDEGRDRRSSRGGRRRGPRGRGRGQADEAARAPAVTAEIQPETSEAEPVPVVESRPLIDEAAPAEDPLLTQEDEPNQLDAPDDPSDLDADDGQNEQIEQIEQVEQVEQIEPNDQADPNEHNEQNVVHCIDCK